MLSFLKERICCTHWNKYSTFTDLHRGGDGEIYVRSKVVCRECGKRWTEAVRLPNVVAESIDENLWIGTLEKKQ